MKRMGPSGGGSAPGSAERNYCLRLNDYEKKYAESFRGLREDESFADVTLIAGSEEESSSSSFKAHRVILSACSSYFHSLLLKSLSPWQVHPVLLLTDVRPRDLQALLDFIYLGQVNISNESLSSFLSVAQRLRIKGLCETSFQIPASSPTNNTNASNKKDPLYVNAAPPTPKRPKFTTCTAPNTAVVATGASGQILKSGEGIILASGGGEEVPSSAVTEFITSNEGDFIPSLPSHPFMITSGPPPPPGAMVTIEDKEPEDLTPPNTASGHHSGGGEGNAGTSPPKKERNSRKTCGYCHKDFHEMSLKRHIKDVHFKNENTYVICPQCCKQYASQNSLYSHLNRVHGVKKESMEGLQVMMERRTITVPVSEAGGPSGGETSIMELTNHSDSSNG